MQVGANDLNLKILELVRKLHPEIGNVRIYVEIHGGFEDNGDLYWFTEIYVANTVDVNGNKADKSYGGNTKSSVVSALISLMGLLEELLQKKL